MYAISIFSLSEHVCRRRRLVRGLEKSSIDMVVLILGRSVVGLGIWLGSAVIRSQVRTWQQKKLSNIHEKEFTSVQRDWETSVASRLEILADETSSESAEWLNTLSNVLWDSVLAPISEEMIPPLIRCELELVLAAERDKDASIPNFLKVRRTYTHI